jgi:hypothetical protein
VAVALALVALAATLGIGGSYLTSRLGPQGEVPAYSVAQVAAGLADQPRRWLGRTVRVGAFVEGFYCPQHCNSLLPSQQSLVQHVYYAQLVDDDPIHLSPAALLLMGLEPRGPLLDALSRLPAIGPLVPGQAPSWRGRAIYRLRLQAVPCPATVSPCYAGMLLDAIPTDPYARR